MKGKNANDNIACKPWRCTHTHTPTQGIYQNKKQVINDKINIYNQTGILCLYEDTG